MEMKIKAITSKNELNALLDHMQNPERHQEFDGGMTGGYPKWSNIHINEIKCSLCNEGHIVIRNGKNGLFAGCSKFPDCKGTLNINKVTYEMLKNNGFNLYKIDTTCWKCHKPISIYSYFPALDETALNRVLELKGIVLGSIELIDKYLAKKYKTLENRYSKTAKKSYVANICPSCNMIQGMNMTILEIYNKMEELQPNKREKYVVEKIPIFDIIKLEEWSNIVNETLRYYQ